MHLSRLSIGGIGYLRLPAREFPDAVVVPEDAILPLSGAGRVQARLPYVTRSQAGRVQFFDELED